ncbi:hypothetical protein [Actinoplanes flavus]|uniref:Uncharacterized protein n=1 Tax=Actinoplanes flavus TaxID=2820290 RepID=A0ABS3ULG2_9ACTN|nr:hypothetical protein [Actinoplanes flavus]MBO3739604.1 hypothetical protein [Actinoplanes flavus]
MLTVGDTWSTAELDGTYKKAFQLGEACDGGPAWPESCELLDDFLLDEAWPGYRTEGAYYIAGITLLNQSGKSIEEHMLLFTSPASGGLRILADQAEKCGATRKSSAGETVIYRFPAEKAWQKYLILQRTVAIQLTVPDDAMAPEMIKKALRRAAEAG